jgi:hypothetical protein
VVSGLSLSTTATTDSGAGQYPITVTGTPTAQNYTITVVPGTLTVNPVRSTTVSSIPPDLVVSGAAGSTPQVNTYAVANGGLLRPVLSPFYQQAGFPESFTGGIRAAAADFNGDGVSDIVLGSGPGMPTLVVVLDGATRKVLFQVQPFEASFTGGVFVAVGDVTADGIPDLVITPDEGGGPVAAVYDGAKIAAGTSPDAALMVRFFGIQDPNFRGGARAAVGDFNKDGYGDVAVAAGFGGGPRVSLWDGKALSHGQLVNMAPDFFAFGGPDAQNLRNGVYIGAGDVTGDGFADLVFGGGPGGGRRVVVVDGKNLIQNGNPVDVADFFTGDPNDRGGVPVAVKSVGTSQSDVIVGAGAGGGSQVTGYTGASVLSGNPSPAFQFTAFDTVTNGVYVG